ncbi:MAG TPA: hypothetical protein VMW17_13000 [Candidatus Binatia bacterium]|nr:hypothetical protein [Candidatus Binatia bacterium]
MRRTIVVGAVLVGSVVALAAPNDPPVVMLDLGPLVATPAPTPEAATRKRLITSLTIQNAPTGESVMNFECSDVAEQANKNKKYKTLAASRYALSDDSPKLQEQRRKIIAKIRDLEHDLLDYVKVAGPPKARRPLIAPDSAPKDKDEDSDKSKD